MLKLSIKIPIKVIKYKIILDFVDENAIELRTDLKKNK